MALWTDIIDPATLTGYARASLADYEARKGTLARWLPNRTVPDIVARFVAGSTGLIDVADFRAYDAEPKAGKGPSGKRVTLELPALGRFIPVSEYNQLRALNANQSDDAVLVTIRKTTDIVVRAIADALEWQRGVVLQTGRATVPGFMDDDFGRSAGHTVTAPALWSVVGTDALGQIQGWCDTYEAANGEQPGSIVTSTRVLRAMAKLSQFANGLLNGVSRPATVADVNRLMEENGLPPIYTYNRNVQIAGAKTKVLSDDRFLLLPAPVETDAWEDTELGATFLGRTLSSVEADWGIEDSEQPGVVAGVFRNEKPPMIAEVYGDAIGMPVLANADLSFVADVL
ncbi:major capsid protein [Mumia sp. DW29H23]|uniref:major capsid protein n=1 Tax=Mumia sp. DW29H23 TaxID=3421241 RepID=UPI003D68E0F9